MLEMNINQLMELTGKSFRTIKSKITDADLKPTREDGKASYYETRQALEAIYGFATELAKENLLLERARRQKADIEVGQLLGKLVSIDEAAKEIEKEYTIVRAQLRTIPSKLAKPLSLVSDPHECFKRLSEVVDECLSELSADTKYENARQQLESVSDPLKAMPSEESEADTEIESGGVGRHVQVSEPGVE
jgi:hypothetical protein